MKIKQHEIKGVIFDLDGTLIDTEYLHWQGWVEVLKPHAKSMTKEEYVNYVGKQGEVIESELFINLDLLLPKNALLEKKQKILIDWFETKSLVPMPFVKEAIEYFCNKKLKVACASGSPRDEALLKLTKVGLLSFFEFVISGNDVEKGKPFPDTYLLAVEKLGLKPENCLAFEDTQYGVASAKSAGLVCYAIPNEFTQGQDFSQADGIFNNLQEAVASLK